MSENKDNTTIVETEFSEEESFEFEWNIKNLKASGRTKEIKSPIFEGGSKTSRHTWQLEFIPKVDIYKIINRAPVTQKSTILKLIHVKSEKPIGLLSRGVTIRLQFIIYSGNNLIGTYGVDSEQEVNITNNGQEFSNIWEWLFSNEGDIERDLKITCKIFMVSGKKEKFLKRPSTSISMKINRKKVARCDFSDYLESSAYSDVILRVGSKSFKAHKLLLSAKSPVFERMFASGMKEATSSMVDIKDFDEKTVEGMLQFIYKGKIDLVGVQRGTAFSLLEVGEKYGLEELRGGAEDYIKKNLLKIDDITELLEIMVESSAMPLIKSMLTEFVIKNKKAISELDSFKEFTKNNPEVAHELFLAMMASDV